MRALQRKLLRDLRQGAGMLLGVVAIMAVGVATFVALGSAQRILEASQRAYYREYALADFWVDVKKAPLVAVERVARLPGVARLEARVVFDVLVEVRGARRPLTGRLLSTPADGLATTLNGLHLVRGTGFSDDRDAEVVLSDPFAQAHGLVPGDRVHLVLNRKRQSFVVTGTAISPEYAYMVRGPGDLLPDPEHFGVLYVEQRYARELLDFQGACNQVVGTVVPGREHAVDALLDEIDRVLEPYGVLDLVPRRRQASHRYLSDEIAGLEASATIMPAIFLVVAALVLNILMVRLVRRQRTLIGTLKALGHSDGSVVRHFLWYGIVVGAAGGVAGGLLGCLLSDALIDVYRDFFQFPRFLVRLHPDLLLLGLLISVAFAVLGTLRGVLDVLRLLPAEAMRERPPERGGRILLERVPGLWRRMGFRGHMALRSVFRNRVRTATAILASALATALVLVSLAMWDSFHEIVDHQFEQVVRSDVDIGLRNEQPLAAVREARRLPGVARAEPVLGVVCDLRNGPASRRMTVMGLDRRHALTTPRLADGAPVRIPDEGLVMARKLAELLDVRAGDSLVLRPVRGRREPRQVRVASVVQTFLGLDCYASIDYLSGIVGESLAVNVLQLDVEPGGLDALYSAVRDLPDAQGLSVRAEAKRNLEKTLVETTVVMIGLLVVFAGVISLGSAVNSALVEIGDRMREISTLRVLGWSPAEVSGILLRQSFFVFLCGTALAIPLGVGMLHAVAAGYDSELYRMPVLVRPGVVVLTVGIALVFELIAYAVVRRRVARLDWLSGVKVKE